MKWKHAWQNYLVFLLLICVGMAGIWERDIDWNAKNEQAQVIEVSVEADAPSESAEEENLQYQDDKNNEDVKPKIALTFDDGPHPEYTVKLLDGLKERNVKATFFVIGKYLEVDESAKIVKRMYDEGHLIGNHTYNHVQIDKVSDEVACDELLKTSNIIEEITGEPTQYIRPPFGQVREGLDCGIPMILVGWTLDTRDWATKNVSEIVNSVVTNVEEDDIILLHDYYESSVDAALQIIDILTEEGYRFVTVDEILVD